MHLFCRAKRCVGIDIVKKIAFLFWRAKLCDGIDIVKKLHFLISRAKICDIDIVKKLHFFISRAKRCDGIDMVNSVEQTNLRLLYLHLVLLANGTNGLMRDRFSKG